MDAVKNTHTLALPTSLDFVYGFARMCHDGWTFGYHERNGGNASYRLSADDIKALASLPTANQNPWVALPSPVPEMASEFVLVTGAGKFLRNVLDDSQNNAGIIELSQAGDAWRLVWGFEDGSSPTSEISAHLKAHAMRKQVTGGTAHVLYHAHPTSIVALTMLVEPDAYTMTRLLWSAHTESIIAIPEGVGVLPWMSAGSVQLADNTATCMRDFPAVIWQLHGVFASGNSFDEAFGLVHTLDKAADAYLKARAACASADQKLYTISDANLKEMAEAYQLPLNKNFLE